MRRECPEIAIRTQIDTSERLMGQVQDCSLDLAVIYAAPSLPGVIAELLFEEKLVLVRTTPTTTELTREDDVEIDWGDEFAANYHAAFPDQPNSVLSISYGPLALERSEEHTSELQSLMRISYAVFCLQNTTQTTTQHIT